MLEETQLEQIEIMAKRLNPNITKRNLDNIISYFHKALVDVAVLENILSGRLMVGWHEENNEPQVAITEHGIDIAEGMMR